MDWGGTKHTVKLSVGKSKIVKSGLIFLALGFGVLALPAILGGLRPAPGAFVPSPLPPSENQISESTARERCEAAVGHVLPGGVTPQLTASVTGSRPLNGDGRLVKVTFSVKNSRNVDLEFWTWCEVRPDGRTDVVSLIEIAGRDHLASSHSPTVRNDYLQKMKIAKYQSDANRFSAIMANRNDFSIKGAELACRITYSDLPRHDDRTLKIGRIIPAGGTTTFQLPRPSGAQSMTCQVTDFFKISSDEQRLIDVFGPTGGQSNYSRLRQDAIRVGISIDILVEPFITMARTLASYQH